MAVVGVCVLVVVTSLGASCRRTGRGDVGRAGHVAVRDVPVELPERDVRPGAAVVVRFAVFGDFGRSDELVAVRSTGISRTALRWDRDCDGVGEDVEVLPIVDGSVPGSGVGFASCHLALVDVTAQDDPMWTVPLEFEFRRAGVVTVLASSVVRGRGVDVACSAVSGPARRIPGRTRRFRSSCVSGGVLRVR